MPAKSKAQFRFMKGVAKGSIKRKALSPEEAEEYTAGQSPRHLPAKKKPPKRKPLQKTY